eukprot:CAMPEP_0198135416 /NCGR_PEP_ID=MMETSP1442-20131203/60581_1 /TAXON_ID= /ORGANISM="Craspedostauros australis, Strain CCMP3328" /LENGTH=154 /DNA_ID=CAMNT_0043796585 /DNA_START=217 /DNA_END=683 /DNA_ORIENTATION=-
MPHPSSTNNAAAPNPGSYRSQISPRCPSLSTSISVHSVCKSSASRKAEMKMDETSFQPNEALNKESSLSSSSALRARKSGESREHAHTEDGPTAVQVVEETKEYAVRMMQVSMLAAVSASPNNSKRSKRQQHQPHTIHRTAAPTDITCKQNTEK